MLSCLMSFLLLINLNYYICIIENMGVAAINHTLFLRLHTEPPVKVIRNRHRFPVQLAEYENKNVNFSLSTFNLQTISIKEQDLQTNLKNVILCKHTAKYNGRDVQNFREL